MKLHGLDLLILLVYLIATVLVGWLLRRRARQSQTDYMMGGKKLPWYMLGLSNASDMFDISGTMFMVTIGFVYGFKSIWIVWLWPVFNQIFQMMYLNRWLRRSNAATGAEWLKTRFGTAKGSELSHLITVIFALIGCLGFMAYGFVGLGKFIEPFLPWSAVSAYVPFEVPQAYVGHFYGIVFTLFAVFYAVIGGMTSIVWGDVIMYSIMTLASVCVAYIAMHHLGGQALVTPEGWGNPFFGWHLGLDWSGIIPEVNQQIAGDGFAPWGAFFMMMTFKGVFASMAGPAPNYDMQKILSTKSPEDASKMTGFVSIILLPVRYAMITGFVVLALLFYNQLNLQTAKGIDYEKILPEAIAQFAPVGIMGLVLTGLTAAFMGTFAGTLNAAQSYFVNDIYLKYLRPQASLRSILNTSYVVGISVVVLSMILGIYAASVNSLLQWITGGLYAGYIAANVLKWYWWRFNAHGFAWGMVVGTGFALLIPTLFPHTLPLWVFPLLFAVSLAGSLVGTFTAPPADISVLKDFYKNVRPWGFWKPVEALVVAEDPGFKPNQDFKLDMFNVVIGIIAQTCLTLLPMYFITGRFSAFFVVVAVLAGCAVILKRTWWDRL